MGVISIQTISKELMLACRQLGYVVPEALASLVASTIVNPSTGNFFAERPIEENDARMVVEKSAKLIIAGASSLGQDAAAPNRPTVQRQFITTLKLQASYEHDFADSERRSQTQQSDAKQAQDRLVNRISNFDAKFDQDFDTLAELYNYIYKLLMLRCSSALGSAKLLQDTVVEREVAAALESVFPRVGLRSFVALTGPEKAAQLQELSGIVLGIRLFNLHQGKGGTRLPDLQKAVEKIKVRKLLDDVKAEVDEVTELCNTYAAVIMLAKSPEAGQFDPMPTETEIQQNCNDLMYLRQYLSYLLNLLSDISESAERMQGDHKQFSEELIDLDALVGGRVSVPKEHVYPRFDNLSRSYRHAFQELTLLESRAALHTMLRKLRSEFFPQLDPASRQIAESAPRQGGALIIPEEDDEPVDLDAIHGPASGLDGQTSPIRLTVDDTPDFLQLPLDFQGFCIHALVTKGGLLLPGKPTLGVVKYAGRYCVFATETGMADFCNEPDKYFAAIRETCYKNPELIHLLRLHEDFPRASLVTIVKSTAGSQAALLADVGTETPLHFVESNIDPKYEWNEWRMRRDALKMADIKKKATSTTQTIQSHLRRETETQMYLPKDIATNTTVDSGTNPPRLKKYHRFLRGEPRKMQVTEIRFDL